MMRVSQSGSDAIRAQEGFSATAYPDPGTGGEPWTIGFGTTRYLDGEPVKPGDRITMAQASELFAESLRRYEDGVNRLVRVPINQQQFDALVSLAYNIGVGALEDSTLLRKLNSHDYAGAADEFLRWNRAGGRVMEGLRRRRERERALFLGGSNAPETPVTDVKPSPAADKPEISPLSAKPMAPVVAALIPSLLSLIPELGRLLGSGSDVSNRNIAATTAIAERVAEVVTQATDAPNLQGAVESMQADSGKLEAARAAIRKEWFDLQSRSTADARKFVAEYGQAKNVRTVVGKFTFPELLSLVFIGLASLGVGYLIVSKQLVGELLGGVVTLMLIGGWTEIRKFWFGLGSTDEPQRREP